MKQKPLFSILHTSARPSQWRTIYDEWMANCVHPDDVEYVLCIDPRWGFSPDASHYDVTSPVSPDSYHAAVDNLVVVQNNQRRCYVDGVNLAAKASTGQILIVNADDQYPCEHWDYELLFSFDRQYPTVSRQHCIERVACETFVVEVSTGTDDPKRGLSEHDRNIMVMPVLSRARYEKLGYVFYPEYESMCADNDFSEMARRDDVVIDARHLMFPHKHWLMGKREMDDADHAQNRKEAYEIGLRVLTRRRATGFKAGKRCIALCLSGERFEGRWVDFLLTLYGHLINLDFSVYRIRSESETHPHVMRMGIQRSVLTSDPRPDICLWLDDDNVLSCSQFDQLLADLDAHPEADLISAWSWIHSPDKTGFMPSCGMWGPDGLHWDPFPPSFRNESELKPFEVGGFPCVLMRTEALEKAGENCFLPVLDNRLSHGMTGEDVSFFMAARKAGLTCLVDPQIRVPHLKFVEVEPTFPEEGLVQPKVAGMLRVRNEARWIRHCIESIKPLCGENIFVMEDGSTDDTRAIAEAAGAIVLESPFADMNLDESRDKDWLLQEVISRCHPDWIIMPDGDEMLEPDGCAKIQRAIGMNPPIDCFALRFLHLWDSVETARFDGNYGSNLRQSLFRANSKFRFRSYYSQDESPNQNHVGLHTSNAPGLGGRVAPLNAVLIHFGALHREDRIRKYKYMIALDGKNAGEDYYRHMVQGDLPQFPAEARFKCAGPLDIRRIPDRLVPQFPDGVPGPRERDWMREDARYTEEELAQVPTGD